MAIVYFEGVPVEFIPKKELEKRKRTSKMFGSAALDKTILKFNKANEC